MWPNESEIFTSSLHQAVGEEKDEAIDGKERTPNNDLSNPADFMAWEGINSDFTRMQPFPPTEMMTPTVSKLINS